MALKVISPTQDNSNKFQDQFMTTMTKTQSPIWVNRIIQKPYMASITNSINKNAPAIRVRNNTFMVVKVKDQERICLQILYICHSPKKHLNSQFLKTIEDFLLKNSSKSQAQEIMNLTLKVLKWGIKFKHLQCQEPPETLVSLNMEHNILHLSKKDYSEYISLNRKNEAKYMNIILHFTS